MRHCQPGMMVCIIVGLAVMVLHTAAAPCTGTCDTLQLDTGIVKGKVSEVRKVIGGDRWVLCVCVQIPQLRWERRA